MSTGANISGPSRILTAFLCLLLVVAVFCKYALAQSAPSIYSPHAQGRCEVGTEAEPTGCGLAAALFGKRPRTPDLALSVTTAGKSHKSRSGRAVQPSLGRAHRHAHHGRPFQFIQAGAAFPQSLFNLPLFRNYQISREGVREAHAQENITREDVTASVVTQYILALRAFATYDAAKVRVALAERLYEQASSLQKTGIGLNIDTTRAQVELQNERQNLIDAETSTHTTNHVLAGLLDLPRDQEPMVTDKLQFFDLPEFEGTAAINTAFVDRPKMQVQASQERITNLERKSALDESAPQIAPAYGFTKARASTTAFPLTDIKSPSTCRSSPEAGFMPKIARADLEQRRIAQNRQLLEVRIVREVKSAIDEVDAARENVDVANLGLQLANDEVAQAERRFSAGVTTNVEGVTAQDALARKLEPDRRALSFQSVWPEQWARYRIRMPSNGPAERKSHR